MNLIEALEQESDAAASGRQCLAAKLIAGLEDDDRQVLDDWMDSYERGVNQTKNRISQRAMSMALSRATGTAIGASTLSNHLRKHCPCYGC